MFSSESLIGLTFMFRSLIHFDFYMWYEAGVQLHSIACGCLVIPAPFGEKTILSLLNYLGTLVKNQLTVNVRFLNSI